MLSANKKPTKEIIKNRFKSCILAVVLFLTVFTPVSVALLTPKPANAGIPTTIFVDIPRTIYQVLTEVWEYMDDIAAVMWKNGLDYFLQRVAYDTATFLATGDKGQKPLFWDKGVGGYLAEIGEEAVSNELDNFSRGFFGVSVCEPNTVDIKLKLILKAKQTQEPVRAKCDFEKVIKNQLFKTSINGKEVDLRKLQAKDFKYLAQYFQPTSNELGIATDLNMRVQTAKSKATELAKTERELSPQIKHLKDTIGKITSKIKTPSLALEASFKKSMENAGVKALSTYTGKPIADAINTFINTFASKYLDRLKKGLLSTGGGSKGPGDIGSYGGSSLGVRAAEATYAEFFVSHPRRGGELSVLSGLAICPPNQPLYNNCIIDRQFATAIEQKMTVREAIEGGYLDLNKTFGFLSDKSEPEYDSGYPYRSLVFLRKYRIIPVTWELAALYIRDLNYPSRNYSLADVIGTPANDFAIFNATTSPFYHLVDPNWVLKIPEFECLAEGPGPEIVYEETLITPEQDPDDPSQTINKASLFIQRADYCANEVSCISEDEDGSCDKKGYCTEEKNIWRFSGKTCEEQAASCQTLSSGGNSFFYLTNTLEKCDASQSGCRWYSTYKTVDGEWASDIWNKNSNTVGSDGVISFMDVYARKDLGGDYSSYNYVRHFNSRIGKCSSASEGCNKFLKLSGIVPPEGFDATTEAVYQYVQTTTEDDGSLTYEDNGLYDSYGEWAEVNEKYLKKAPPNLNCPLDLEDEDRDVECDNFAQSCRAQDVGCAMFTPLNGDPPVPAILKPNDYCSAECVGYDQYFEVATYFETNSDPNYTGELKNLIPESADNCSVEAVGCERFTNLDEAARGGESIEYYSFLRSCILPDDPSADVFYTWEGSDTAGYQLKTWRMEKTTNPNDEPAIVGNEDDKCRDMIVNGNGAPTGTTCTISDDNLNCRQFLDADGNTCNKDIDTVTFASEDCHPYRREIGNELMYGMKSLSDSCQARQNGCHEYRGNNGNAVVMIVNDDFESGTTEGWTNGSNSNVSVYVGGHSLKADNEQPNKRIEGFLTQDKNYTLSFWAKSISGNPENVTWEIQGYQYDYEARNQNFWSLINVAEAAQGDPPTPVAGSIRRFCKDQSDPNCGQVSVNEEWQYYRLGPLNLDRSILSLEKLQTSGDVDVYFDNIILREVTDSYYLIKDSQVTPASCDEPFQGAQVGCQAYRDSTGQQMNLLGFTSLCSSAAVGCQAFIDTHNTDSPFEQKYNMENNAINSNDYDDLTVPNDSLVFLVDDKTKYCPQKESGCSQFGQAIVDRKTGEVTAFSELFLIDNPEKYNQILCGSEGLYCRKYQVSQGQSQSVEYYVDPGARTCEYRVAAGGQDLKWYKTGTDDACNIEKSCSNNPGASCESDSDCGCTVTSGSCITQDNICQNAPSKYCNIDADCANICEPNGFDEYLTEDNNNGICVATAFQQPVHSDSVNYDDWVGVCGEKYNGCSQYIDPEVPLTCTNNFAVDCKVDSDCQGIADKKGTGHISDGVCRPNNDAAYYYLQQSVDPSSCDGIVDRERGCLLFNQTNRTPAAYTEAAYDASLSPDREIPKTNTNPALNDANIILKVERDRVCSEWLYCRTRVEAYDKQGNKADKCFDIGLCKELNKNECSRTVNVKKRADAVKTVFEMTAQQVYGATNYSFGYTVEDMRFKSGYSKAGMKWLGYPDIVGVCSVNEDSSLTNDIPVEVCKFDGDCVDNNGDQKGICQINNTINGYLPFSQMRQVGESSTALKNGSFEEDQEKKSYCAQGGLECFGSGDSACYPQCNEDNNPIGSDTCDTCGNFNTKKVCSDDMPLGNGQWGTESCETDDDCYYNQAGEQEDAGPCVEKTIGECSYNTDKSCTDQSECPSPCQDVPVSCNPCVLARLSSPFAYWESKSHCGTVGKCDISSSGDTSTKFNQSQLYIDGQNIAHLKINQNQSEISNLSLVQALDLPQSEYVLSGSIRWDNVIPVTFLDGSESNAHVAVRVYETGTDNELGKGLYKKTRYSDNWERFSFRFTNSNRAVEVRLALWDAGGGDVYFDNIRIEPALKVNNPDDPAADEILIGQSCRMYPKSDAKSCNVTIIADEKKSGDGKVKKTYLGWPGYCVETDPRNPQYCLNWWPVDGIRGSQWAVNEELLPFKEKLPLYYCLQAKGNESSPANSERLELRYKSEDSQEPFPQYYTHSEYEYEADRLNVLLSSFVIVDGYPICEESSNNNSILCTSLTSDNEDGPFYDEGGLEYHRCESDEWGTSNGDSQLGEFSFGGCGLGLPNLFDMRNMYAGNPSQGTMNGSWLPETNLFDWEIEYIELRKVTTDSKNHWPDWVTLTRDTNQSPPEMSGDWWYVDCYSQDGEKSCAGGKRPTKSNGVKFGVSFENNHPRKYFIQLINNWDHDIYDVGYNVIYHLREPCTVIARVGQATGDGSYLNVVPYWTRVQENTSFSGVPTLNYGYDTDSAPYGAAYQSGINRNEDDPEIWDSVPDTGDGKTEPGTQPLYVYAGSGLTQADGVPPAQQKETLRAGTPYSCEGNCGGSYCVGGGNNGISCNGEQEINDCYGGGVKQGGIYTGEKGYGVCVGATKAGEAGNGKGIDWARDRLRALFARSVGCSNTDTECNGVWKWGLGSNNNYRYIQLDGQGWNDTQKASISVPGLDSYIPTNPEVGNIKVDGSSKPKIIDGGGGTVKLEFTSDIADDQLPLVTYIIDWGDGDTYPLTAGSYDERPSPGNPHTYYHYYSYDETKTCEAPLCEPTECAVDGEDYNCKVFQINIKVQDNWGKVGVGTSTPISVLQGK